MAFCFVSVFFFPSFFLFPLPVLFYFIFKQMDEWAGGWMDGEVCGTVCESGISYVKVFFVKYTLLFDTSICLGFFFKTSLPKSNLDSVYFPHLQKILCLVLFLVSWGGGEQTGGPLDLLFLFFFLASLGIACWDPLQIGFSFPFIFFLKKKRKKTRLGCFYVVVAV